MDDLLSRREVRFGLVVTSVVDEHHEAMVRHGCESKETTVVVAEDNGGVVGFVGHRVRAAFDGDFGVAIGKVEVIAVGPRARGRATGQALLHSTVSDLGEIDIAVIMLETAGDDGHAPARALYESDGFRRLPTAQYWLRGAP